MMRSGPTAVLSGFLAVFLVSCSPQHQYKKIESKGITIYAEEETDVQAYFQAHHLMVSPIVRYHPKENRYQLTYPSTNHGASPRYSQLIEIHVADNIPLAVADVMESDRLAILHATDDRFVWNLVGTAPASSATGLFDWFSDKHLYRFSRFNIETQEHDCCMRKR